MTNGPIKKTILKLALPLMASSFLGTLYNICDMAWVGTLGARAVAGVGVGGMYLWLSSGFAALPRMGGQVLTAQSLGAGEKEKAKAYTKAAIHLVLLLGLLFGCISLLFTGQLVSFFHLEDHESVSIAFTYLRITCGFVIFNFLNLTLSGLYTADGDSRTPMTANFCGLLLNILLDPLLITGYGFFPRLEATGAAIATVVSQMVVSVILVCKTTSRKSRTTIFKNQNYLRPGRKQDYKRIFQIGIPASLQSMIYCFISMILSRFVSVFGAEAFAVSRVGGQIESISWNTADGFGSALNSFCGQNFGAGKYDRIRKGYYFSIIANFIWGTLVLLCFVFFPEPLSRVFFHEELAIRHSISYLFIIGFCEPFMMVELVTAGALSGLGETSLCSILSITLTGLRIPIAFLLQKTALGANGIWLALSVTSVLKGIVFCIAFLIILRRKNSCPH